MLDWNAIWMQEIVAWELARQRHHERYFRPVKDPAGRRVPSFLKALPVLPILMVIGGVYGKLHG